MTIHSPQDEDMAVKIPAVRKYVTITSETVMDEGHDIRHPVRRAAAMAVITNPFAGHYARDLSVLVEMGATLGAELSRRAMVALGDVRADGYGKGAIVGEGGALEHAAALLHPAMGAPLRASLGGGRALIPSAKKMGGMGCALDVPTGHKDAAFVRSHFDAMEVRVQDAPRHDEIVVAVVLTCGGRPLSRVGGLAAQDIQGEDGLR